MKDFRKTRSLFKFGNISRKHFILYILSPFTFYFNNILSDEFKKKNKWYTTSLSFFAVYLGYLLIGGILLIYSIIINKKQIFKNKQKGLEIKAIRESMIISLNIEETLFFKNKYTTLFIIVLIDCLSTYIFTYFQRFSNFFKYLGYLYPLEIIIFILLSKLILKLKINKHHLFSIIIIIIGLLIINIINLVSITYSLNELFVILGLLILVYLYPLLDIIVYYILYEKEFYFPLFLFFIGIMGILIGIIMSFLKEYFSLTFLNVNFFNDLENFKDNKVSYFLLFILMSLANGITYSFLHSIFKLFKPWAYAITAVINGLLTTFNDILNVILKINNFDILLLFQIVIYIILFFACLIFNEQIICNFWGLNKNTKEEIIFRASIDLEMADIDKIDLEENEINNSNIIE